MHEPQTTLPAVADQVDLSSTRVRTDDWPVQATDSIVKVVGTAKDKVTGPITTVARAIVFGTFATILGTTALVLFSILLVRVLNNYLPDSVFGEEHIWAADVLVGLLFVVIAMVLLRRAKKQPVEE